MFEKHEKTSDKLAQIIRVLSVPPLMVTLLLLLLWFSGKGIFRNFGEVIWTWLFLAVMPALAYPLSLWIPRIKEKGRDGQRDLAFLTSAVGYGLGLLYAIFLCGNGHVIFITGVYVLSVLLLLLFDKGLHIRVSGHACSVTGPLAVGSWYLGWIVLLICVVLYAGIFWASLRIKRHTVGQFIGGTLICLCAIGLSFLICRMAEII